MKKLFRNKDGSIAMVAGAIGVLITLIIAILIFYSIAASIDTSTSDSKMNKWYAGASGYVGITNASNGQAAMNSTLTNTATFFTIAPIVVIVMVAVIVIGYVKSIG